MRNPPGLYMLPCPKNRQAMNDSDNSWSDTAASTIQSLTVPAMEAGGSSSICPEGNSDHSEFPELCERGGSGVACRPPKGLLGGRTEMAACHWEGANFCPGD